jgi:FMN phosphatase YigB (HAD superfamily)
MIHAVIFDCLGVLCDPSARRNEAAIELVRSTRGKYKTALLSNINRQFIQRAFSDRELRELFDEVLLSTEVGVAKPMPEIYDMAALRLGVLPGECIMIDDSEVNVDGARRAGMRGVLFETPQQCRAELAQLLEVGDA